VEIHQRSRNHPFEPRKCNIEIRSNPFRSDADLEQNPLGIEQVEGIGSTGRICGLGRSK